MNVYPITDQHHNAPMQVTGERAPDGTTAIHVMAVPAGGGLPVALATEPQQQTANALLTQIRDAQAAQATAYTDDTGALFFRGAGGLGYIDATGAPYTPTGAVVVAGSGKDTELLPTHYDATVDSGNGWAVGDELAWVQFIDTKTSTVISEIWLNVTQSTIISAVPQSERAPHETKEHTIAEAIRDHQPRQGDLIDASFWAYCPAGNELQLLGNTPKRRSAVFSTLAADPNGADARFFTTLNVLSGADSKSPFPMLHGGSVKFGMDTLVTSEQIRGYAGSFDATFHVHEQAYV